MDITGISLGYTMLHGTDEGRFATVPTWDFVGWETMDGLPGAQGGPYVIASFNAIDGMLIRSSAHFV